MLGLEVVVVVVVVAAVGCRCSTSRQVIDKAMMREWERVKKEERKDWRGLEDGAIAGGRE